MINFEKSSDEELVEHVQKHDVEIYRHLVERYQDKLMRCINIFIKNEARAADVVQNSFIKAYVNLNSFDIRKKWSSWIFRIAHNEAMNEIKKNRRELPLSENFDLVSTEVLEENIDTKEIITRINKCLDKTPLKYSEPLTLFYLENKSYEEISDILRLPVGTVGTRINRAKLFMKHICQEQK